MWIRLQDPFASERRQTGCQEHHYFPGHEIKGHVHLDLQETLKCAGIYVSLIAYTEVRYKFEKEPGMPYSKSVGHGVVKRLPRLREGNRPANNLKINDAHYYTKTLDTRQIIHHFEGFKAAPQR